MDSGRGKRILIVEDDRDIAEGAQVHLEEAGYEVGVEHDGSRGLAAALGGGFDLCVVDLMLPGTDGLEICRALRSGPAWIPIVIMTARGSELDRVLGLELGADDYLVKPVSFRELVARVRAIFRRVQAVERGAGQREREDELIQHDGLELDPVRRNVRLDGESVDLTAREFDLLLHFARHPGRVFRRDDLVAAVWGAGYDGYEHTVNSHINRLRAKINGAGERQRFIETVWGVGYRFAESTGSSSGARVG